MSGAARRSRAAAVPGAWRPDEHGHGFSSLALLSGAGPRRRLVYLLSWFEAILTIETAGEPPRSRSIRLDGWERLPLADASADTAIVDLDAVPGGRPRRRELAVELTRVLDPHGRLVAVLSHRRRPRNRRDWWRYRLVPAVPGWRRAFGPAGLRERRACPAGFDGDRLTAIDVRPPAAGGAADALAIVMARPGADPPALIDVVERAVARDLGAGVTLGRLHVRKIGKTAAFATSAAGPIVVRLPRSAVAVERARRAEAALEWMHGAGPRELRPLVPRALGRGLAAVQPYFTESALDGRPREAAVAAPRWEPQALRFITELHAATAHRATVSNAWFEREVESPLRAIETVAGHAAHATLEWLRRTVQETLVGREVPLVRSHGDFTGSNCLYDRQGRLSGVVDWELSRPDGLPLLDLLQSVDLPAEHGADGRWLRAELILDGVAGRGLIAGAPEIRIYGEAIGLDPRLIAPLLLMHWIDHAGARIAARSADARWLERRVLSPLARLRQLAAADLPGLSSAAR